MAAHAARHVPRRAQVDSARWTMRLAPSPAADPWQVVRVRECQGRPLEAAEWHAAPRLAVRAALWPERRMASAEEEWPVEWRGGERDTGTRGRSTASRPPPIPMDCRTRPRTK